MKNFFNRCYEKWIFFELFFLFNRIFLMKKLLIYLLVILFLGILSSEFLYSFNKTLVINNWCVENLNFLEKKLRPKLEDKSLKEEDKKFIKNKLNRKKEMASCENLWEKSFKVYSFIQRRRELLKMYKRKSSYLIEK